MVECHITPTHQSYGQDSNSHSLSPTHNSKFGYSSPPNREHKISYQHLCSIHPITRQFEKEVAPILGIQDLPYASRKLETTPTGVVVLSVEETVLSIVERMEKLLRMERYLQSSNRANETPS